MPSADSTNYQNLLRRYEGYAPNYDRKWGRYSAATLSRALEAIPIEGYSSLIDVACGTGILAEMLRQHRPNLHITGIDISPDMLAKARQRIPPDARTRWLVGQAETLPVEARTFDVLTCTNAFHLVQNAPSALAEFRRVLRPGGTLVLVDWCRDFPLMKFRTAVLKVADKQRRQIRTMRELADLLEDSEFKLRSLERFRARSWGLMCVVARSPEIPVAHSVSQQQPSRLAQNAVRSHV
jgi:ubiquinone/menaquinone biosynthesis C-methylase UbiE